MARQRTTPFPTKEQVVAFIKESGAPLGKRALARAFQIAGDDRAPFKALLKEIEDDGLVERRRGRKLATGDALPPVAVLIVRDIDADGEVLAVPERWDGDQPPRIFMTPERRGHPALSPGDRVLARLRRLDNGDYEGRTLRRLDAATSSRVVGIYRRNRSGDGQFTAADRRQRDPLPVADADAVGVGNGELVVAELTAAGRLGTRRVRIVERLGDPLDRRAIGLVAIHAAGIPTVFPDDAVRQAESARLEVPKGRTDLRSVPLVTIDGADARDFDDAVWAEPDPERSGGWHLIVAIADVAHYVAAGSALDREAFRRGNSCYLPDRVVPMLPEALSNGLCSLVPGEDRLCLAAHLWIDGDGRLHRHRFERGVMRSAARLTYEQVQSARNGEPDETTAALAETVLDPLYGAFSALTRARAKRGTLDLDLPERVVRFDEAGHACGIGLRLRLDSHRLIEEFMIAANVAAAEALTHKSFPCLYRVHDAPDRAKLEALREFLSPLGYAVARGQVVRPRAFTQILERARGTPHADMVNEMVLRCQAQAAYAPDNIGHFGLALPLYTHFTSPIRRYADLTVHRALIRCLGLGGGDGTPDEELARLEPIGEHISITERRAASAERDALDRFVAAFLSDHVGGVFHGRVTGVTRFGLFVRLHDTGADGLVPVSTLPDDFYHHDSAGHALIGERWGRVFRLGAQVRVRLAEADPVTGSCVLGLLDAEEGAPGDLPEIRSGAPAGRRRQSAPRQRGRASRR